MYRDYVHGDMIGKHQLKQKMLKALEKLARQVKSLKPDVALTAQRLQQFSKEQSCIINVLEAKCGHCFNDCMVCKARK